MKHTGFKVVVIILLVALLAVEGGRLYIQWQQWLMASAINDTGQAQLALMREEEARRGEVSKLALELNVSTNALIDTFIDNYHQEAYSGGLDRITEQQLTAAEYTLQGLWVLMKQNQVLLQVLAGK